ncbi:MAG: hypothetical protein ACPGLY_22010 [Rubripirellula sp.]
MWLRYGLILAVCDLGQSIGLGEQVILHNVQVASRDALIRAVRNAQPGTQILIAGGELRGGFGFRFLRGTELNPIVTSASDRTDF